MYAYKPTEFNGTSLTGGNFRAVWFDPVNGPLSTRRFEPVEAEIVGAGDRDIRAQPKGATWELHCVLENLSQTDIDSFYKVFNEAAGQVTLKAQEGGTGTPPTWRVQCRVIGIRRVPRAWGYFIVVLRVSDPVWKEDSLTTTNRLNLSGDSDAFTLTNNGNRTTKPTLVITGNSAKTDMIDDFRSSVRGHIEPNGEKYFRNYPVELLFDAGALDHSALVKGSLRALVNQVGGIGSSDTSIPYDTGQNGNPSTRGMAILRDPSTSNEEQIYYTGGGGAASGTLTGVVRGIGGTTAQAFPNNAEIYFSEALRNGDDVRVFVNDVEVERWLFGVDTTDLRCWVNLDIPPQHTATLQAAMTAGSPANGGSITVNERVSDYPERGYIKIDNELIAYNGRSGSVFTDITRGYWGTTAASHNQNVTVKRIDHLFVVAVGKALADGGAPDAVDHRPAIQLSSKNSQWKWGDTGDDLFTRFYDPDNPARTAMFRLDATKQPDNQAPGLIYLLDATSAATWTDDDPRSDGVAATRLVLPFPQDVTSGTTMTYNVQQRADHNIRILLRDKRGQELFQQAHHDVNETSGAKLLFSLTTNIEEIIFENTRAAVTGNDETGANPISFVSTDSARQKMVLDQETEIKEIHLRLKKTGAGDTFSFVVRIRDNSGSSPDQGIDRVTFDTGPSSAANITTSYAKYAFSLSTGSFTLPAGTYWIELEVTSYTSGQLDLDRGKPSTKNDVNHTGFGFARDPIWFRCIHAEENGGPVQPEADRFNAAAQSSIDSVVINCGGKRPTIVRSDASFGQNLYHCTGQLSNAATGQTVTIDKWMSLGASLTVDFEARTVLYSDNGHSQAAAGAITLSDPDNWFHLNAGSNNLTYAEPNMVDTTLQTTHRGAKV